MQVYYMVWAGTAQQNNILQIISDFTAKRVITPPQNEESLIQ